MINIVLIGAGNAANSLGKAFHKNGCHIMQVFSRELSRAEELADLLSAQAINSLYDVREDADVYILAVPDNVITTVAEDLFDKANIDSALVVHVSGNTPLSSLSRVFTKTGVFYPLQTMTVDKAVDFENVPIIIDSTFEKDLDFLEKLASKISDKVYRLNDKQRVVLHLSAVFCNNFVNLMYSEAFHLSREANIPVDLFYPLMLETARKAIDTDPEEIKTGPAIRKDVKTILSHLEYLDDREELKKIYRLLTERINPKLNIPQ